MTVPHLRGAISGRKHMPAGGSESCPHKTLARSGLFLHPFPMPIQLSAKELRRAADIKEAIEKAEKELATLLGAPAPVRAPASAPARTSGRSHTMTALVREIVRGAGRPLTMDEIMAAFADRGRPIAAGSKARKMFGTVVYKTSGVKRVGRGLFAAAK